jgi:hypothetical protein
LDRIYKRVFREKANCETQQKEIKTFKVFPESYKLKIKKIIQENKEDDLDKKDLKKIIFLQEQRVINIFKN